MLTKLTFPLTLTLTFLILLGSVEGNARQKRQASQDNCDIADIIFVLDSSGSIGQDNWYKITNFTKSIVQGFRIGPDFVRIGVNWYGNEASLAFDLNTYNSTEQILEEIDNIKWKDQETNTSGGIRMMHRDMFQSDKGDRPNAPNIGIVITDGVSTRDPNLTIPEAIASRGKNIVLFAIGIGDQVSTDELNGIGNSPSESYVLEVEDFNALPAVRKQVVTAACQAASDCYENGDIAFLLDSSGSLRQKHFDATKEFIKEVVNDLSIDNGLARVGLVTYSDNVTVRFDLDTYNKRADIVQAIDEVPWDRGTTNTAEALLVATEQLFTEARGDRQDFPNIMVLFTDGGSNDFSTTLEQARQTRLSGITILVVAITNWVNSVEVTEIASFPAASTVFNVPSFESMGNILSDLKRLMCNDVNECSSNPCQNGGQCQNLIGGYICLCLNTFAGINCQIDCPNQGDIVLAVDSSSSIGETRYWALQKLARLLVENLNIDNGTQMLGYENYGNNVQMRHQMNSYTNKKQMIESISYPFMGGNTATMNALGEMGTSMFTSANGDRASTSNFGVVVSDGESSNREGTFSEAVALHIANVSMFSVGVNVRDEFSRLELRGIATNPDTSNYLEMIDFSQIEDTMTNLMEAVCNSKDGCSSNPCQGGGECVNGMNKYECQCPTGRSGTHCERACDGVLDIAVAIDSSGSIRNSRFTVVKEFVKSLIMNLEVRPGRTRVSVLTFADNAVIRFFLSQYELKEDVLHAIDRIQYSGGKTNTASALQLLRNQIFQSQNGDREEAPNIAVIVSDGNSNVDKADTIPEAIRARLDGIHMIVTSVENSESNIELQGIASDPDEANVFNVARFDELSTLVSRLVDATCNAVDECSSNPCQNGGQCLNGLQQYICLCSEQWSGVNCERSCNPQKDVVFLLDISGSVEAHIALSQIFTKAVIQGLNFDGSRTRVGLATYQDTPIVRFYMASYSQKLSILNAVAFDKNADVVGTNIADAIKLGTSDLFNAVNGDRSGVDDILIIVTDGRDTIATDRTLAEAENAKQQGIRIIVVAMGVDPDNARVNDIANSPTSSNVFFMQDISSVDVTAAAVLDELCA